MSTTIGVIKKFVKTLVETKKTGTDAVNAAFKAVGAGNYAAFQSTFSEAKSGMSYQDFLEQKCGIRLNNKDTGAITGSDAGGSKVKTAESIVPETAKAVSLTKAQYNSFTKNGLTVNITYASGDGGRNFGYDEETYLAKQKLVVRAIYNWWLPESLDLINESLGINFTDGRANINEMDIVFDNHNAYSTTAIGIDFDYDMGLASKITMHINPALLYNITASDKNGTLDTDYYHIYSTLYNYSGNYHDTSAEFTNYLDRLFLQAMAEVTLKANVAYVDKLPQEIRSALCEIVGGYDDASTKYAQVYGSGYSYLRYLAKNYSDGIPDGVTYNAKKTVLTVTTDFTDSKLDLADFASTVKNVNASALKSGITIVGNKLDNSIRGGSGNDSILGGAGNDSLWGGKGNDTLTGGNGNDVFIYSAGKDFVTDYAAGDKIKISSGKISKATVSGSDVVFTIGSGTLTVKKGAGVKLSMIDSSDKSFTTIVGGNSDKLTLTNSSKSPVTIDSAVKTVDASARTKAVKITGNTLANTISGGSANDSIYGGEGADSIVGNAGNDKLFGEAGNDVLRGGSGNDTLTGGKGNDSLWGGSGKDTFIYADGEGNDVIYSFGDNDLLKITGKFSATYDKTNDEVYFKIGTTKKAITLSDFAAESFHVNGTTYKISGSKLVKK